MTRSGAAKFGARLYYAANLISLVIVGAVAVYLTVFVAVLLFVSGLQGAPLTLCLCALMFGLWMGLIRAWKTNQAFLRGEQVSAAYYWTLPAIALSVCLIYAVAVPKFDDLTRNMVDGATRGNLGAIRSALSIYYGDMEGEYPQAPEALSVQEKYLTTIPRVKVRSHENSHGFTYLPEYAPMDTGNWGYVNNAYSANMGTLFVDCSHTDLKGSLWYKY